MADESKALTYAVLRTAGFAQSIFVGSTIVFVSWILLVDLWPEILIPSVSLGPELQSVNIWLGPVGWVIIYLIASAMLGEAWLGVVRHLMRAQNRRRVLKPTSPLALTAFSSSSLDLLASKASKAPEMRDLEEADVIDCTRLILLWVIGQSGRSRTLQGEGEVAYQELRGQAELRLGLIPWLPLSLLITVLYLNMPPGFVSLVGLGAALVVAYLLVVGGLRRWLAADSFLLQHLVEKVDWSHFARLTLRVSEAS